MNSVWGEEKQFCAGPIYEPNFSLTLKKIKKREKKTSQLLKHCTCPHSYKIRLGSFNKI